MLSLSSLMSIREGYESKGVTEAVNRHSMRREWETELGGVKLRAKLSVKVVNLSKV